MREKHFSTTLLSSIAGVAVFNFLISSIEQLKADKSIEILDSLSDAIEGIKAVGKPGFYTSLGAGTAFGLFKLFKELKRVEKPLNPPASERNSYTKS